MNRGYYLAIAASVFMVSQASAQERVIPASNIEALFQDSDPKLNANKQVVYHIVKDILGAGRTELVDKYMTPRYIQHNPNFPSGTDPIKMLTKATGSKPVPEKLSLPVVAVLADDDLVVVASVSEHDNPKTPGSTYTTTHFDMWRIKDGKADEHWDESHLGVMPPRPARPQQ